MSDVNALARQFVGTAVALDAGQTVWIEYEGADAKPLADACVKAAEGLGGKAYSIARGADFLRNLLPATTDGELEEMAKADLAKMQDTQAYIRICEVGDEGRIITPMEELSRFRSAMAAVRDFRINKTRWLVVHAPSKAFADLCGMEHEAFQTFYNDACLFDYKKMYEPARVLREFMTDANAVEIKGKNTHLKFSIEGIGARECIGKRNIPDGEVYTAPVKGSVEGHVLYGPSAYMGQRFSEIYLRYSEGKVIEARGGSESETANLNKILDTDAGARYPGEWAMAFHPLILEPVGEILFDEKIRGSWHMANGQAYKGDTDNGNNSEVHWDKVQIQRPDHGGGEIWMDGRLVRKDGLFVVPELEALNPEKLEA